MALAVILMSWTCETIGYKTIQDETGQDKTHKTARRAKGLQVGQRSIRKPHHEEDDEGDEGDEDD